MKFKFDLDIQKLNILIDGLKKLPRKTSRSIFIRIQEDVTKQIQDNKDKNLFTLEFSAQELDILGLGLNELPMENSDNLFLEIQNGFIKQTQDSQIATVTKEVKQKRKSNKLSNLTTNDLIHEANKLLESETNSIQSQESVNEQN